MLISRRYAIEGNMSIQQLHTEIHAYLNCNHQMSIFVSKSLYSNNATISEKHNLLDLFLQFEFSYFMM